jgi:hypothetical protein
VAQTAAKQKLAFLTQNKDKLCKFLIIITLVFEKNANFFDENCRKSQKIVIITSTTPGHTAPDAISFFINFFQRLRHGLILFRFFRSFSRFAEFLK